ncbi:MAG: hypothetical protein ACMXYB_02780, partial [Candidatus Woesearchaeota archaeon]
MEISKLNTKQNVKKGGLAALLLGSALGVAGCSSAPKYTPLPTDPSYEIDVTGIPVSSIKQYSSSPNSNITLPAYIIDGTNYLFIPETTSKDIRWLSQHRKGIRPAAECPIRYDLLENQILKFQDESYCVIDVCYREDFPFDPQQRSGNGAAPGNGGPSNGGPSNSGPSNGGPSNGGPSNGGPSNGGPSNGGPSNGGPS